MTPYLFPTEPTVLTMESRLCVDMLGSGFPPWAPATVIFLHSDFQFVTKPNPARPSLQQAWQSSALWSPVSEVTTAAPQHTPSFVYFLTWLLKVHTQGTLVPTNPCAPFTQRPTLCHANSACWLAGRLRPSFWRQLELADWSD